MLAAIAMVLTGCGSSAHQRAAITDNGAALCRRHLADAGAGATLHAYSIGTAADTVRVIKREGGNPAPWDHVGSHTQVARCVYALRPGPGAPVQRCGPDIVVEPGTTTAYYYDAAGHHSVVHIQPLTGSTQCTGIGGTPTST